MKATELRKAFLDFFKQKGHAIRPSDWLVPANDPTLLFTTAGMVQFKSLFAGAPLAFSRAATVQKCLRAGGKGSDLENVGKTLRHHTLFEMLGNFSFGDYFKEEAIAWAWEFVTQVLKMPKEKIWVSVYQNDDEALNLWLKHSNVPKERIVKLGEKDNFWGPAGTTGACGPCSEIYFDLGKERGCGKANCAPGCDCERYLEFWNLVFPQFFQEEDGNRRPLERRGIDTGMGLERLAFLMQGVQNNYETDLFKPIVDQIQSLTKIKYSGDAKSSFHVAADHVRALTFAIAENILPSNEGRGYVLRRILRRAARHGRKIGLDKPFLYQLVPSVVAVMRETYPELEEGKDHVTRVIHGEEERFFQTLTTGLNFLDEKIAALKKKNQNTIEGDFLFKLYDTYGFPLDLTREIADDEGIDLDIEGFETFMGRQKELARKSWKGKNSQEVKAIYEKLAKEFPATLFQGYAGCTHQAKILCILKEGNRITETQGKEEVEVILNETPFYAESGGQVGDPGILELPGARMEVTDTQEPVEGVRVHVGKVIQGKIKVGDQVTAKVDEEKRCSTARNHTATHLLHNALRTLLGNHVKQAGSLVAPDRLRFDFNHFSALTSEEIHRIESYINEKIMTDDAVSTYEISYEEVEKHGVIAFFGEKYKDKVRVVDVGGFSKELCGGTHVSRAGNIGFFKIIEEVSVAAGIRRIEALTGKGALEWVRQQQAALGKLSKILKSSPEELSLRLEQLLDENKKLEKKIVALGQKQALGQVDSILAGKQEVAGIPAIVSFVGDLNSDMLRTLADDLKTKIKEGLILLGANHEEKANLVILLSDSLTAKGWHAGKLIKEIAKEVGGSGGGRPEVAQAGGRDGNKVESVLKTRSFKIIEEFSQQLNKK